tara:strand:- start:30 stop:266 length:237 start_codon:yes stop_codon:yes gene_type:complete
MLGFSLPKIIILLIILILIWNIFRYFERRSEKNIEEMKENRFKSNQQSDEEESLIECESCGSFFSSRLERKCPECLRK